MVSVLEVVHYQKLRNASLARSNVTESHQNAHAHFQWRKVKVAAQKVIDQRLPEIVHA
jgi:hypothetical protein